MKRRDLLSTFAELGAAPEITDALTDVGITSPFPIQEMAIPIALTGTDLIAQARTGTGKTLAFGIPLLQRIIAPKDRDYSELDAPGKPQALVVAPTRELASQVADDLIMAGARRELRVLTVYGGVAYEPQLDALQHGVDMVVGTPGRLLDLSERGELDLGHVKALVLDEADRMLDLGFLPDVERLIALTHETRQTMLFSATMPSDIVSLARRHMRHPVNVRAEAASDSATVPATAQFVYRAHSLDKPELLARILQADDRGRSIIFCTTKRSAQRVADDLSERGFAAGAIHGDLGQVAREKALERFRAGTIDVLVATDVAARGIDVEAVTHVINHTCPEDEKTYLHRIGRTGRAGATGIAITLVDWNDLARWKVINAALELPFQEPPETYSTSDHIFTELGIPKEATGKLSSTPQARSSNKRERRRSSHGNRDETSEPGDGSDRPRRRRRTRRRSQGGVDTNGVSAEATPQGSETGADAANAGETETTSNDTDRDGTAADRRPRRRRRRRRLRGQEEHNDASSTAPSPDASQQRGSSAPPASSRSAARSGPTDSETAEGGEPATTNRRRRRRRRTRGGEPVEGDAATPTSDSGESSEQAD